MPGSAISRRRGVGPTFVLPLLRLDGARSLPGTSPPHDGTHIDPLAVAPKTVGFWVDKASLMCPTVLLTGTTPKGRCSGELSSRFWFLASWRDGHSGIATCWSSWSHVAFGHKIGYRDFGDGKTTDASSATTGQVLCSTVATNARPCRQKGTCTSHRRCARLHAQWISNIGSSLHTASFRTLAPFFQLVFPERQCQVFWHNRPPDGLLEGHIFTDGSSSGNGALRRAGWLWWRSTVWETSRRQRMEQSQATFCLGSRPEMAKITLLPWQASSPWTPLTLHIDCECTVVTINGPKHKALGARGPRAHVWSRLLFSHDEVKAIKVATQRDVEAGRTSHLFKRGNDYADIFAKRGADTHKPAFRVAKAFAACASLAKQAARWAAEAHVLLRFRGWNDTRAAAPRSRVRPPRARLKRRREMPRRLQVRSLTGFPPTFPSTFLARQSPRPSFVQRAQLAIGTNFRCGRPSFGQRHHFLRQVWSCLLGAGDALCRHCSNFPGGRTSQLRKLRSGLFPNKRYPGWTVEHVRRPTLDEATTLVAQLESCEAGLGRTVMGPTTPKTQRVAPQAAMLAHWERVGDFSPTTKTSPCSVSTSGGRSSGRRVGSTISWSLSSHLKAGGVRSHKTD